MENTWHLILHMDRYYPKSKATDFLIKKVLKNKGIVILQQQLDDSLENMAEYRYYDK